MNVMPFAGVVGQRPTERSEGESDGISGVFLVYVILVPTEDGSQWSFLSKTVMATSFLSEALEI